MTSIKNCTDNLNIKVTTYGSVLLINWAHQYQVTEGLVVLQLLHMWSVFYTDPLNYVRKPFISVINVL